MAAKKAEKIKIDNAAKTITMYQKAFENLTDEEEKKVNLEEEKSLHFKAEIRTFVELNVALLSSHRFHCIWDVALKLFVFLGILWLNGLSSGILEPIFTKILFHMNVCIMALCSFLE